MWLVFVGYNPLINGINLGIGDRWLTVIFTTYQVGWSSSFHGDFVEIWGDDGNMIGIFDGSFLW